MKLKTAFAPSLALGLALCAAAPGVALADDTTKPPLLVSEYLSAPTWIYYKNGDRYDSLAYADKASIYNRFTALRFTNTST